ncbi:MAG: hypothetical protein HQK52_22580 [Oligoflexia bacterium]|nr:hypothetical protein [Oligoflexia bacterium]
MHIIKKYADLPSNLIEFIKKQRWIFASENHDDDFHTDVLFLRVSCGPMRDFAGFANSSVISLHNDFNSKFFYEEIEDKKVVKNLVERFLIDGQWRESIAKTTGTAAQKLMSVWNGLLNAEALRNLSLKELEGFYQAQLTAHLQLYLPAWTAEVLQASGIGLTEVLLEHLRIRAGSHSDQCSSSNKDIFNIFNTLTTPDELSIFGQEQKQLLELANQIHENPFLLEKIKRYPSRGKLYLPGKILEKVCQISQTTGFFAYHGFSKRQRITEDEVIERLINLVCDDCARKKEQGLMQERTATIAQRKKIEKELNLSADEISIFRCYGQLGNAKVLRRLAQLYNFSFLDALIRELAIRLDINEALFRFMTPEEFLECFHFHEKQGLTKTLFKHLEERVKQMTFVIYEGEEYLLVEECSQTIQEYILEKKNKVKADHFTNILNGIPVSSGQATGRALIAIRNDSSLQERFKSGDILVSVETDPDLVPLMRRAAAIVTDQGGITSHAAIIARELGIPCVTGVDGATSLIKENDLLRVDANNGIVEILPVPLPQISTATSTNKFVFKLSDFNFPSVEIAGRKATALNFLMINGHHNKIPEGFLVKDYVHLNLQAPEVAIRSAMTDLDPTGEALWAVRSSCSCEDGETFSQAGRFASRLNIKSADVVKTIDEMQRLRIDRNNNKDSNKDNDKQETENSFYYSLLVMKMVAATHSGVVLTTDPRSPYQLQMIIETTEGLCDDLVSGRIRPHCAFVDIKTGNWQGTTCLTSSQMQTLLKEVKFIKQTLKQEHLDIEFSFAHEKLYILQARNLSSAQMQQEETPIVTITISKTDGER